MSEEKPPSKLVRSQCFRAYNVLFSQVLPPVAAPGWRAGVQGPFCRWDPCKRPFPQVRHMEASLIWDGPSSACLTPATRQLDICLASDLLLLHPEKWGRETRACLGTTSPEPAPAAPIRPPIGVTAVSVSSRGLDRGALPDSGCPPGRAHTHHSHFHNRWPGLWWEYSSFSQTDQTILGCKLEDKDFSTYINLHKKL